MGTCGFIEGVAPSPMSWPGLQGSGTGHCTLGSPDPRMSQGTSCPGVCWTRDFRPPGTHHKRPAWGRPLPRPRVACRSHEVNGMSRAQAALRVGSSTLCWGIYHHREVRCRTQHAQPKGPSADLAQWACELLPQNCPADAGPALPATLLSLLTMASSSVQLTQSKTPAQAKSH